MFEFTTTTYYSVHAKQTLHCLAVQIITRKASCPPTWFIFVIIFSLPVFLPDSPNRLITPDEVIRARTTHLFFLSLVLVRLLLLILEWRLRKEEKKRQKVPQIAAPNLSILGLALRHKGQDPESRTFQCPTSNKAHKGKKKDQPRDLLLA